MTDELRAALAAVPALAGYDGPLERLGGLTNMVYRAGEVCLRIPGKGTEEYINRANEAVAARERRPRPASARRCSMPIRRPA